MSTHPNAMLLLVITPDGLTRKTYRDIMSDVGADEDGGFNIGDNDYNSMVMEDTYSQSFQISAKEGDIVIWDLVTYGYGERIAWGALEAQKNELAFWAKGICENHHCSYEIYVSANYW